MSANVDNAVFFLVSTLCKLYLWVLILRVLLQLVRADFFNPFSQVVWRLTQPLVGPLTRVIPRYQRWDLAGLLTLYLFALAYTFIIFRLLDFRLPLVPALWLALINVIALTLTLLTFSIFVQAILSWLGPGVNNRAGSVLWSINEPVLRPIRRFVPAVSGLDLSPLIAILLLQVAYYLLPLHPVLR
jgi:YggT family protein